MSMRLRLSVSIWERCGRLDGVRLTGKQRQDCFPALSKIHSRREKKHLQRCVDSIDTMVKQLAQRTTLVGSSCLTSIDRIECLVEKQTYRPAQVNPGRAVLIQRGCVPEQRNEVRDNEAKARESDLVKADQRTIQGTLLPCRKGRAGTHEIRPVVISFDQFRRSLTYAIHIGKHFMTTCV